MLGTQASGAVKDVIAAVATDLQACPATTMYIIIPPNQVHYGVGRGLQKTETELKVLAHHALWKAELDNTSAIFWCRATVLFSSASMYSDDRDLGFEAWSPLVPDSFSKRCAPALPPGVAMLSTECDGQPQWQEHLWKLGPGKEESCSRFDDVHAQKCYVQLLEEAPMWS